MGFGDGGVGWAELALGGVDDCVLEVDADELENVLALGDDRDDLLSSGEEADGEGGVAPDLVGLVVELVDRPLLSGGVLDAGAVEPVDEDGVDHADGAVVLQARVFEEEFAGGDGGVSADGDTELVVAEE